VQSRDPALFNGGSGVIADPPQPFGDVARFTDEREVARANEPRRFIRQGAWRCGTICEFGACGGLWPPSYDRELERGLVDNEFLEEKNCSRLANLELGGSRAINAK
jgi:hypothetical protein